MPPLFVAPAANVGGAFSFKFTIDPAIVEQLRRRDVSYPIPWTAADARAVWLMPSRLLASIFIAYIGLFVNMGGPPGLVRARAAVVVVSARTGAQVCW